MALRSVVRMLGDRPCGPVAVGAYALAAVILLVAGRGLVAAWRWTAQPGAVVQRDLAVAANGLPPAGAREGTSAGARAVASVAPEPPPGLEGFAAMPEREKLSVVTGLQGKPGLGVKTIAFLLWAIRDRQLYVTTRNNIANVLIIQRPPVADLSGLFIAMVEDRSEANRWRDYAVQHLASCVPACEDPDRALAVLREQAASGDGGIPGTAMLQLDRLERLGLVELGTEATAWMARMLGDAHADLLCRMTALALAAKRHDDAVLPQVRLLAHEGAWTLRRGAISALGELGQGAEDRAYLEALLGDPDAALAAAARGALHLPR